MSWLRLIAALVFAKSRRNVTKSSCHITMLLPSKAGAYMEWNAGRGKRCHTLQ